MLRPNIYPLPNASSSIPRLSQSDQVAALCRNKKYISEFEPIRKWVEPALRLGVDLYPKVDENGKRTISYTSPNAANNVEAAAAITSFLGNWPMLRAPIHPEMAKKDPGWFQYFQEKCLCDTVEVVHDFTGKRGVCIRVDPNTLRSVYSSDIFDGRFLTLRIDLSKSKEEIAAAVVAKVTDYQGVEDWSGQDVRLPPPNAKTGKQKAKTKRVDRWEVYDFFTECEDVRTTAKKYFPGSYNAAKARLGVKKEADAWLAAKAEGKTILTWLNARKTGTILTGSGTPRGCDKYLRKYESMLARECTPKLKRDRDAIEKWIRTAVQACERLISSF